MKTETIPYVKNAINPGLTSSVTGDSDYVGLSQRAATKLTGGAVAGIPDAPKDGKMYARQDEKWVEIPAVTVP